jgi:hypothetical protein
MSFEKFVPLDPGEMMLDAGDGEIYLNDFFSAKKFDDSRGSQPSQIRNCRHVELYLDGERALGIKPVEKPKKLDPSVYKATQNGAELKIRCPSFLWLCHVFSEKESYRLRATWSQKEGMFIAKWEDEI